MSQIIYKPIGEYKPQPLHIINVIGDTWISKTIEFFMKLYSPKRLAYSHSLEVINPEFGKDRIIESLRQGQSIENWTDTDYYKNKVRYVVFELVPKTTFEDCETVTDVAEEQCFRITKYWFGALLDWIIFVLMIYFHLKPIWLITINEKLHHQKNCSYLVMFLNKLIKNVSNLIVKPPQKWSPNDIAEWGAVKEVYRNWTVKP
jgi:hypothetical protein